MRDQVRRAAPRVLCLLLGLVVALTGVSHLLGSLVAALALFTSWPRWWRWVRTGESDDRGEARAAER